MDTEDARTLQGDTTFHSGSVLSFAATVLHAVCAEERIAEHIVMNPLVVP